MGITVNGQNCHSGQCRNIRIVNNSTDIDPERIGLKRCGVRMLCILSQLLLLLRLHHYVVFKSPNVSLLLLIDFYFLRSTNEVKKCYLHYLEREREGDDKNTY